jgi:D-alanyl-D-alanine carboxypeptidase
MGAGWTAQIGVFTRMSRARIAAISVRQMRGIGIPRIARFESHGRTLWTAQLAGLTLNGAHQTCSALAARRAASSSGGGGACFVIAPQSDHLAMLSAPNT